MLTFSYNSAKLREGQARFGDGGRRHNNFKKQTRKTMFGFWFPLYCKMFGISFSQLDTHIHIRWNLVCLRFEFRVKKTKQ